MKLAERRDPPGIAVETRPVDCTSGATGLPASERRPAVTGGTAGAAVRLAFPDFGGVDPSSPWNAPEWYAGPRHTGRNVDVKRRRGGSSGRRRDPGSKGPLYLLGRRGGRWGLLEQGRRLGGPPCPVKLDNEYDGARIFPRVGDAHVQESRQGFTTACDRRHGRFPPCERSRTEVGETERAGMRSVE